MPYLHEGLWYCRAHGKPREGSQWAPLAPRPDRPDLLVLPDNEPLFCAECNKFLKNPLSHAARGDITWVRRLTDQQRETALNHYGLVVYTCFSCNLPHWPTAVVRCHICDHFACVSCRRTTTCCNRVVCATHILRCPGDRTTRYCSGSCHTSCRRCYPRRQPYDFASDVEG